jgi:DNA-binding NarL/FixJ family response regulator
MKKTAWFFSNRLRGESHPRAKLTNEQVRQIRTLYNQGFSVNVIARNFKVSKWNIEQIVKNITWTHI